MVGGVWRPGGKHLINQCTGFSLITLKVQFTIKVTITGEGGDKRSKRGRDENISIGWRQLLDVIKQRRTYGTLGLISHKGKDDKKNLNKQFN